jgi:hypothetical protein
MYQAVRLALNHRNENYEFKAICLQKSLVYPISWKRRFKKLVHTFPVNDVVQIRTIENLVLADTFIALTKNRFCSLRHLRPREAFGMKSYLAMLL